MKIAAYIFFISFALFGYSQSPTNVYFISDAGEPKIPNDKNLDYLKEVTQNATEGDVLIFLGDDVYPRGLPGKEDTDRSEMETKLNKSLEVLKEFKGHSFIIPGNHDWANGRKNGWSQVLNMQAYVSQYMGDNVTFQPRNACPGPVEIEVNESLALIIIDLQYFLHPWEKPGEGSGCEATSSTDALLQFDDLIEKNKHRNIIVAAHHPMYSDGGHGGKYTWKQHLFPLTDVNRKLWIPLPVIGSFYPTFRSVIGSRQDIANPRYKVIRNALVKIMKQVPNLVFINGHEHSLQYIKRDSLHFITSGTGSKTSNVSPRKHSVFASETQGFAQLTYLPDTPTQLTFYDGYQKKIIYSEAIFKKDLSALAKPPLDLTFQDSTILAPISSRYGSANKTRKYWLGENYREVWATPTDIPVFNIGTEHGGLTPIKLGGGNQTKSLRLEAADGRQYVLRSLEKYTEKLIPKELYETLAAEIIQDQISAANPFGAFAIPPLAEAAGIYHTNPQLVYIPDDPRFGQYQETFAGLTALYEERPNNEAAHLTYFGGGEKVKGTPDVIAAIQKDNDESIDQSFALRSRMFDMIIGDWDRHEDQWRWIRFDDGAKGHFWRPIPRDRDQAFFVNQGLIGWFASRKFALPNTEGFDEEMDYPPGFNASGRFFDRTFLNELDWSDWEEQIQHLKENLTDQSINEAFEVWPDTIYEQAAPETIDILKARRDDLERFTRIHYEFLSQEVEVVGSDKHEYFLVDRLNDQETRVTVNKRTKDGELKQVMYDRTFLTSETKEIRLYGLDGEDVFDLRGDVNTGICVRIIGGTDRDRINDQSLVRGLGKKTKVYDRIKSTEVESSGETKIHLSNDPTINAYNRTAFEYDKLLPIASLQYNRDDGLFIGAGFIFTKEGWRKDPFQQQHKLSGNASFATGAINLHYEGIFTDVVGKWDLNTALSVQRPFGVNNFFGFGNESIFDFKGDDVNTSFDNPIQFYRVRYEQSRFFVGLRRSVGNKGVFKFGPEYLQFELDESSRDRFIFDGNSGVDALDIQDKSFQYLGGKAELSADTRDHAQLPSHGVFAQLDYRYLEGINSRSGSFAQLNAEFRFLLSTKIPSRLTIANRVGTSLTFGELTFFNGATLGKETIRGFRRTRFVGNSSVYHNVDLRLRLFSFRSYLFPASVGLIAFHDIGRVWLDGESSSTWHSGRGFGISLAPLNQFVITGNIAFTNEENLPFVTFGYQF